MSVRELTNAREIIAELGGLRAVAQLTARKYTAVSNWGGFDKFPADTFIVMQDALHKKGITAPPSMWGMIASDSEAAQ